MALRIGQYAVFPTEKLWNATIDMALEKKVKVWPKTSELRRYGRFPCLKMGERGLAGFRPEGKPGEEQFEELPVDDFICELLKSGRLVVGDFQCWKEEGVTWFKIGDGPPVYLAKASVESLAEYLTCC